MRIEGRYDRAIRWLLVAAGVCAVVSALGCVGRVWLGAASEPRFEVQFRSPDLPCERDENVLLVDGTTGQELVCSAGRAPVAPGDPGELAGGLSAGSRQAITTLAVDLARDGGLTDNDRRQVLRLADRLATSEGYDQSGLSALEIGVRVVMGVGLGIAVLCLAAMLVLNRIDPG